MPTSRDDRDAAESSCSSEVIIAEVFPGKPGLLPLHTGSAPLRTHIQVLQAHKCTQPHSGAALAAASPALPQTPSSDKTAFPGVQSNLLFIIAHSIFKSMFLSLTVTE